MGASEGRRPPPIRAGEGPSPGAPGPDGEPAESAIGADVEAARARLCVQVAGLVGDALERGQSPAEIRRELVRFYLGEPTLRAACEYEREAIVADLQRAVEAALAGAQPGATAGGPDPAGQGRP